jgi:CheY-like chemotaxis protein
MNPASSRDTRSRGTILCVDNHPELLEVIASVLRRENYAVRPAADEEGAKEILREHLVDAAVIDVRLHDEDQSDDSSGLLLAKEVAASGIPVIVISSYDLPLRVFAKAGASGAVSKKSPTWKSDLIGEIRRVVRPMVYLSHGRSPRTSDVALHIGNLGLRVCIQETRPGGEVILAQLATEAARAEFAVVLLTGEDTCTTAESSAPRLRARQNVLLEWGYLLAVLGPANVLALAEDGVELPSSYGGFVYEKFDDEGNWRSRLTGKLHSVRLLVPPGAV